MVQKQQDKREQKLQNTSILLLANFPHNFLLTTYLSLFQKLQNKTSVPNILHMNIAQTPLPNQQPMFFEFYDRTTLSAKGICKLYKYSKSNDNIPNLHCRKGERGSGLYTRNKALHKY